MVYGISFTAPSNQLNGKRLFAYIWYLYSDMSVGVVRNYFDYGLGPCSCGGDGIDEIKI